MDYMPQLAGTISIQVVGFLFKMLHTLAWQGDFKPFSLNDLREDVRSGRFELIEKRRLPAQFMDFPEEWTPDFVYALTKWIRSHQARIDMGDVAAKETAFQFAQLRIIDGHCYMSVTNYQDKIGSGSDLEYSHASAFYYATLRETSRTFCPPTVLAQLEVLAKKHQDLNELFQLTGRYERFEAPEVSHLSFSLLFERTIMLARRVWTTNPTSHI